MLVIAAGTSRVFERVMDKIPMPLAGALLAGVLARFALDAFVAAQTELVLVAAMALAYLLGRRLWPRYAIPGVLLAGIAIAAARRQLHLDGVQWGLTLPVWTAPDRRSRIALGGRVR